MSKSQPVQNGEEWPEGKVAVRPSRNRTSQYTSKFHTERCKTFPENPKWWRLEICEAWEFEKCKYCSGDVDHAEFAKKNYQS